MHKKNENQLRKWRDAKKTGTWGSTSFKGFNGGVRLEKMRRKEKMNRR